MAHAGTRWPSPCPRPGLAVVLQTQSPLGILCWGISPTLGLGYSNEPKLMETRLHAPAGDPSVAHRDCPCPQLGLGPQWVSVMMWGHPEPPQPHTTDASQHLLPAGRRVQPEHPGISFPSTGASPGPHPLPAEEVAQRSASARSICRAHQGLFGCEEPQCWRRGGTRGELGSAGTQTPITPCE